MIDRRQRSEGPAATEGVDIHTLELFGRYRSFAAVIVTLAAVFGALAGASEAALPPGCSRSGQIVSCSISFTSGSNPFTVPAGVRSVHVVAVGGMGGGSGGGHGAVVNGELSVSAGSTLYAVVGGNGTLGAPAIFGTPGANGGGHGGIWEPCVADPFFCTGPTGTDGTTDFNGGGGGGASDVRISQGDLLSRLLIAAGGGGSGSPGAALSVTRIGARSPGGAGGGGNGSSADGAGGAGGSSSIGGAGGAGGTGCTTIRCTPGGDGGAGAVGVGGDGGNGGIQVLLGGPPVQLGGSAGGGGGGLFGGGGGGGGLFGPGGGGGGGSNLVPPGGSQSVDTTGIPMVQISYKLVPVPPVSSRPLKLSVSPRRTKAGRRTCFVFKTTSTGHVVAGVTVGFARHTARTSHTGKATVCLTLRRGKYHPRATKTGYRPARATITATAAPTPRFTG